MNLDDDIPPDAVTARVARQTLGTDQKWKTAGSQDVGLSDPFIPLEG